MTQANLAFSLRPYQKYILNKLIEHYQQNSCRILVPMATGMGKTMVFSHLPETFPECARRGTLVLVHREELLYQARALFELCGLSVGIEMRNYSSSVTDKVVIASVQSVGRSHTSTQRKRLQRFIDSPPGLVIVDEAHHITKDGIYDRILNDIGCGSKCGGKTRGGGLLTGFTATPKRADGKALTPFFDVACESLDLGWGIKEGHLVNIAAEVVHTYTDLTDVKVESSILGGRDFNVSQLERAVNTASRNAAVVKALHHLPPPPNFPSEFKMGGPENPFIPVETTDLRRILCFCASVAHAHEMARALTDAGIPAEAIDGTTPIDIRRKHLEQFKTGKIAAITNCGVLTEGFDAPHVDTVVMCRPTLSHPLFMQMLGRGTRTLPGVLDGLYGGESNLVDRDCYKNLWSDKRKLAIEKSDKPWLRLIDVVDNVGTHKVLTMGRALGLHYEFFKDREKSLTVRKVLEQMETMGPHQDERQQENVKNFEQLCIYVKRSWLVSLAEDAAKMILIQDLLPGQRVKGLPKQPLVVQILSIDENRDNYDRTSDVIVVMRGGERCISGGSVTWKWCTKGVRDVEKNELYTLAHYKLAGTVLKVDTAKRIVTVTHCRLTPWSSEQ